MRATLAERFWPKVQKSDGCWLWQASLSAHGYGQIAVYRDGRKTMARAHRVAYELVKGPIPDGLTLDHLCRVPACVNPDHLEPVTHRENVLRGTAPAASHAKKTQCPRGHAYDEANTYRDKRGRRSCKACKRIALREWRERRRAVA